MSRDLELVPAAAARGFLLIVSAANQCPTPRLPRIGKRLFVSSPREGGGVDSWIVERRPGEGAAQYSIVKVRNVAIDARVPS